jgi:hypothetical protein
MLPRRSGRQRGKASMRGRPPHRQRNRRPYRIGAEARGEHQPREDAPGRSASNRPPHAAGAPHPGVKDLPPRSRRQTVTGRGACRVWRLETGAASNSGAARRVPAFFGFARNGKAPARPRAGMRRSHVRVQGCTATRRAALETPPCSVRRLDRTISSGRSGRAPSLSPRPRRSPWRTSAWRRSGRKPRRWRAIGRANRR